MRRLGFFYTIIFLVIFNVLVSIGWLTNFMYKPDTDFSVGSNRDIPRNNVRDLNREQTQHVNQTLLEIERILEAGNSRDAEILKTLVDNKETSVDILSKLQKNSVTLNEIQTFMKTLSREGNDRTAGSLNQDIAGVATKQVTQRRNGNGGTGGSLNQDIAGVAPKQVTKRLNVLISASMRTGSSFFGELFKQHPKFLYIFEPLRALKLNDYDPLLALKGVEMMNDMYKCNYASTAKALLSVLFNRQAPLAKSNIVPAWVNEQNCYGWDFSYNTFGKCNSITPKQASESCRTFDSVAVKTIRVFDMYSLLPLIQDPDVNLRVINVLRDPRGMMASVMPIHISNWKVLRKSGITMELYAHQLDDELERRLNQYCTTMLRNVIISKHSTLLPKQNYLPIRYEDMSERPLETAERIFDFLGEEMDEKVERWLNENTKEDENKNHLYYAWRTKRNSKETSQQWRYKMTFELAEKIENTGDCPQYMSVMGYKKAGSSEQLLNNTVSLLSPFNK